MERLTDIHGRNLAYLRVSLTDACNFRCLYCLPDRHPNRQPSGDPFEDQSLSIMEIENLVAGFSRLGFRKIRLTGGEPTLRGDLVDIVRKIALVPAIQTVALTTNGHRLAELAAPLREAGLTAINISLDSLNPRQFARITGSRDFERIHQGIQTALRVGIEHVKVNVLLLRNFISAELDAFFEWVRETPVHVRFIELMQTRDNSPFFHSEYLPGDDLLARLEGHGWAERMRGPLDGPAREFTHPGFAGRLGIISPYSHPFCKECNRLRISSRGKLKLCLFGGGEYSLRHLLQSPDRQEELIQTVFSLMKDKQLSHMLHEGIWGSTRHLAGIGG